MKYRTKPLDLRGVPEGFSFSYDGLAGIQARCQAVGCSWLVLIHGDVSDLDGQDLIPLLKTHAHDDDDLDLLE